MLAVLIAGTAAVSRRLSTILPRKSRVWGQKRRKMARSGTVGASVRRGSRLHRPQRLGIAPPGISKEVDRRTVAVIFLQPSDVREAPPTVMGERGFPEKIVPAAAAVVAGPAERRRASGCALLPPVAVVSVTVVVVALLPARRLGSSSFLALSRQSDICHPLPRSGDARFGVARHVFRSRRWIVSRFLRLHSGRAVDHSLGAVGNAERDHLPGRNGRDVGMRAVSTAGFIRSLPRCNATFRND